MSDAHKGGTRTARDQQHPDSADDADGPLSRFGQWREKIRQKPRAYRLYRIAVGVLGGAIIVGGLALIPLPGPGWVIVFVGLAVLASEFEWAKRLERFVRDKVKAWTQWVGEQWLLVRGLISLGVALLLLGLIYLVLLVYGVPGFIPDSWTSWIPGLSK